MMTPMGKSPFTNRRTIVPDSSRKAKHENSMKVLEILRRDEKFFAQLNLQQGLRSMTGKQFLQIMDYFVRLISGKDIKGLFGAKADILDGIIQFLRDINCPYIVNKSMLKTPNAPHTFDQAIQIMLWLGDFCPPKSAESPDEIVSPFPFTRDAELPSKEYTECIADGAMKAFQVWNNGSDDEFEHFLDGLVDKFIGSRQRGVVNSAQELNHMTEQLEEKNERLKNISTTIPNEQKFEKIEEHFVECETQEDNLKKSVAEKQKELTSVEDEWKRKKKRVDEKQRKIEETKMRIHTQMVSRDEYNRTIQKISVLKGQVAEKSQEVLDQRNTETNYLIQRARAMHVLAGKITEVNARTFEICKLLHKVDIAIDSSDLKLEQNAPPQRIQQVSQKLEKIAMKVRIKTQKLDLDIANESSQLEIFKTEQRTISKISEDKSDLLKKKRATHHMLDEKIVLSKVKFKKQIDNLQAMLKDDQATLNERIALIEKRKERIDELNAENEHYMNDGEARAIALFEQKEEQIRRLDAANEAVEAAIIILDSKFPKQK